MKSCNNYICYIFYFYKPTLYQYKYVCAINQRTQRLGEKKNKVVLVTLGWFKLNTDGSSNQHRGLARGVIGDAFGNWVVGFSSVIDFTTSVMVE